MEARLPGGWCQKGTGVSLKLNDLERWVDHQCRGSVLIQKQTLCLPTQVKRWCSQVAGWWNRFAASAFRGRLKWTGAANGLREKILCFGSSTENRFECPPRDSDLPSSRCPSGLSA